jgi:hypothetical protein
MGHLPVMSAMRRAFATFNYAAPPDRFTKSGSMAQTTQPLAPSLQEFAPVIPLIATLLRNWGAQCCVGIPTERISGIAPDPGPAVGKGEELQRALNVLNVEAWAPK